ncbi:MAG: hypothetical protein RIC16_10355 [Rhodospirillales bacterium]
MTKLLDQAIEKARALSASRQDDAAMVLLSMLEQDDPTSPRLTDEQVAEVRRRQELRRYATDDEVSAFFERIGA